jgi:hypothetical protein
MQYCKKSQQQKNPENRNQIPKPPPKKFTKKLQKDEWKLASDLQRYENSFDVKAWYLTRNKI